MEATLEMYEMYVFDATAIVVYAAFIALMFAYLLLVKWYGPDRAREMMNVVREASHDFLEVMKEGFETLKELKEYAEKRERKEEG